MTFKNIRIKMKGGKSRTQRVKVLASGKYKFVKNIGRRKTSRTRKANPTRRKGAKRMTRRKKRRGGGGKSITKTAFKWLRIGALLAPAAVDVIRQPDAEHKIGYILKHYTGYDIWDNQWRGADLAVGWMPYLAAIATTYGIPKLVSIMRKL